MPRKKAGTEKAATPTPAKAEKAAAADGLGMSQFEIAPELEEDEERASRVTAQAVTFTLGDQLYALPIEVVQEIQQIVEMLPLPDSTPWLVGLIDMRGTVVPAIDLRRLVGLPAADYELETPMVFCHAGDHLVALIVDGVEDVVDLPDGCIQPPSALYSLADRMIGVARLSTGLVPLLDVNQLVPQLAFAIADQAGGGL